VFITREDELGHTPLVVWPRTYDSLRHVLREPFLVVKGVVSRRNGTMNVEVKDAQGLKAVETAPAAKNWG